VGQRPGYDYQIRVNIYWAEVFSESVGAEALVYSLACVTLLGGGSDGANTQDPFDRGIDMNAPLRLKRTVCPEPSKGA